MGASDSTRGVKVDFRNSFSIASGVGWIVDMVKYWSKDTVLHATRAVRTKI